MNNTLTAHAQSKSSDCKAGQSTIRNPSSPPALIDDSIDNSSSNNSNNNAADVDIDDATLSRKYPDLPTLFRLQDVAAFRRPFMTKVKLQRMLQRDYFALSQPLTIDMMQKAIRTHHSFFAPLTRQLPIEELISEACGICDNDADRRKFLQEEFTECMCTLFAEFEVTTPYKLDTMESLSRALDCMERAGDGDIAYDAASCVFGHCYAWMLSFLFHTETIAAPSDSLHIETSQEHCEFFADLLRDSVEKCDAADMLPLIDLSLACVHKQLQYASNATVPCQTAEAALRRRIEWEIQKLYVVIFLRIEDFQDIARFSIKRMLAELENTATEASDADGATGERPVKRIKTESTSQ